MFLAEAEDAVDLELMEAPLAFRGRTGFKAHVFGQDDDQTDDQ